MAELRIWYKKNVARAASRCEFFHMFGVRFFCGQSNEVSRVI